MIEHPVPAMQMDARSPIGASSKTHSTASVSVVSLGDVDFGPLLVAFGGVLRIFATLRYLICARRAVLSKSFGVSDAVGQAKTKKSRSR